MNIWEEKTKQGYIISIQLNPGEWVGPVENFSISINCKYAVYMVVI